MPELLPIDENWKFQVCSVDGTGFKVCNCLPPLKRTYYKNRPWKYCVVIIRWWDDENEGYDRFIFFYDCFSVERWTELMNRSDFLYDYQWEVVYEMVSNDYEEVKAVVNKYLYPTLNASN